MSFSLNLTKDNNFLPSLLFPGWNLSTWWAWPASVEMLILLQGWRIPFLGECMMRSGLVRVPCWWSPLGPLCTSSDIRAPISACSLLRIKWPQKASTTSACRVWMPFRDLALLPGHWSLSPGVQPQLVTLGNIGEGRRGCSSWDVGKALPWR